MRFCRVQPHKWFSNLPNICDWDWLFITSLAHTHTHSLSPKWGLVYGDLTTPSQHTSSIISHSRIFMENQQYLIINITCHYRDRFKCKCIVSVCNFIVFIRGWVFALGNKSTTFSDSHTIRARRLWFECFLIVNIYFQTITMTWMLLFHCMLIVSEMKARRCGFFFLSKLLNDNTNENVI